MKKTLALLLALTTVLSLLAGCGSKTESSPERELLWTKEDCAYRLGRLNRLEAEQTSLWGVYAASESKLQGEELLLYYGFDTNTLFVKGEPSVYDDVNTMLLGLKRGDFQLGYVPSTLGRYIVSRNEDINFIEITEETIQKTAEELGQTLHPVELGGGMGDLCYRMATLPERTELRDLLNGAILALRDDGTLDQLQAEYIDKIIDGKDPESVDMPKHDDWETIRVAVTGDLPPMDFVSSDGKTAGFNVAFLSAVSEKIGCNIELVPMNTGSRLINLTSGAVDVIFWTAIPAQEGWNAEITEEIILTEPYFTTSQCFIYTDYPLAYTMEFELYQVSPERKQSILDCIYWRLAHYLLDRDGTYASYGYFDFDYMAEDQYLSSLIDYLRKDMTEEELTAFLKPYLTKVPWNG